MSRTAVWTERHDDVHEALDNTRNILLELPDSRERSLALTHLEECELWLARIEGEPATDEVLLSASDPVPFEPAGSPVPGTVHSLDEKRAD